MAQAKKASLEKSPRDEVKLDTTQVAVEDDSNAAGEGLAPLMAGGTASTNPEPNEVDNSAFEAQAMDSMYTQTAPSAPIPDVTAPGITSDSLGVDGRMMSEPKGKAAKASKEEGFPEGIIIEAGDTPKFPGEQQGNFVIVSEDVYFKTQAPRSKRPMFTLLYAKGTAVQVREVQDKTGE